MKRSAFALVVALVVAGLTIAACAPAAPAPTAPPPAPTKVVEAAKAPAPTSVAQPTKPAAQPTAAPTKAPEPTKPAPTTAPTAAPARKVDFPQKGRDITIIVPFAAGGATDFATRLIAPGLEKELGAPVNVVNKPGASTQVGSTDLMKSKPDGYTLGLSTFLTVLVTYLDPQRQAAYTRKDFQPVAMYLGSSNGLFVQSDSPIKGMKDLVDAAKAKPETIKVGTAGLMGNTHLQVLMLEKLTGAKFAFVHFDGDGAGYPALLGGHIDVFSGGVGPAVPHIKAGTLRAVGISDKEQSKVLPDVKTMEAQGYPVLGAMSSGISAPAGTPKEIVDLVSAAIKKTLSSGDVEKKMEEMVMRPVYMDPTAFTNYWVETETTVKSLLETVQIPK